MPQQTFTDIQPIAQTFQEQFPTGAMQTKPGGPILNASQQEHPLRAIPRTFLESFGIDADAVENAKSTIDAMEGAGGDVANSVGEGMFNSLMKAGPLAPIHMTGSVIDGVATQLEDGSKKAYQSYQSGDRYGLYQGLTQVSSAMGQLALLREGKEPAKQATEFGGRLVRKATQMPLGIGRTSENLEAGKVAGKASEVNRGNFESLLKDQSDVQDTQRENQRALAKARDLHEKEVAATAETQAQIAERQRLGAESRQHATDLSNGILQDLRDKAKAEASAAYGTINGTVSSEDINTDVRSAIKESLKGSGKTPAILERILVESSPVKGPASGVRALSETENQATRVAADILKKGGTPADARSAMANLGFVPNQADAIVNAASGVTGETAGPTYSFEKLHGIYSELNHALYDSSLQGDEYRAVDKSKDKVLDRMRNLAKTDDPRGDKFARFEVAQAGYSQYAATFEDYRSAAKGGSPVAQALETYDRITKKLRPAYVQQILTEDKAYDLAKELLSRYRHLGWREDVLDDMKDKLDRSKEPVKTHATPTQADVSLKANPPRPELQRPPTFDPVEWRKQRLREFQERMGGRQPSTMWQTAMLPFFRIMSALYSNPAFVKLILGIK